MKRKILNFVNLSVFALLFVILASGVVSGDVFEMNKVSEPLNVSHNYGSFPVTFNITYTGALPSIIVDFSGSSITSGIATITGLSNTTLNQNEVKELTATINFGQYQSGNIAGTIYAVPSSGTDKNFLFSVPILSSSSLSASSSTIPSGQNWDDTQLPYPVHCALQVLNPG